VKTYRVITTCTTEKEYIVKANNIDECKNDLSGLEILNECEIDWHDETVELVGEVRYEEV